MGVSQQGRRRADVLAAVAGIIVFGLMAVQGARFVPFMIGTGETGEDLRLQIWPFMAFLSVCSFVLVARLLANPAGVEDSLRHLVHGRSGGDAGAVDASAVDASAVDASAVDASAVDAPGEEPSREDDS